MKIAQVIPLLTTIPPTHYGGIERIVGELSLGLAKKGHKVSVFAARGSKFKNHNIEIIESAPFATTEHLLYNRYWEIHQLLALLSRQQEYDIIHFHYEPVILNCLIDKEEFNLSSFFNVPFLHTFHNTTYLEKHIKYYKSHKELWDRNYVFISQNQREPLNFFTSSRVIYNGIPVKDFEFSKKTGEYLLFLGRITEVKGVIEAVEVARATGKKLIIGGKIDPVDKQFYERKVKHLIDGRQIIYVGELDFKQKVQYYKNALCLLFPIKWNEPFGLVMVESMACGTPVVAFNRGSIPEVIEDGQTGFVVKDVTEMIEAVAKIGQIDRKYCREYVLKKFNVENMIDNYEKQFNKILGNSSTLPAYQVPVLPR